MIKRIKALCVLVIVVLVALSSNFNVSAATLVGKDLYTMKNVSIEINGKKASIKSSILNKKGHLLLPMRELYEALGAQVSWDPKKKTASSIRNGKRVDLTINSKTAKVDGVNVSMEVAPLLYKNRTYFPLRFASENFDGIVVWNEGKQKVEITLDQSNGSNPPPTPNVPEGEKYTLYINNQKIMMDDPVIIKEGRTYIPAKYFYNYVEDSSGLWVSDRVFEMLLAGLSFQFTDGSNNILVNQEPVSIDEKPFIKSGEMYVPAPFLVKALGGNLRNLVDRKEIYITFNDYMFYSEFLEKQEGSTPKPQYIPNAQLEGSRNLLVSDNPEKINAYMLYGTTATLSMQEVQSTTATNEHRVFGWHLNELGTKAKIAITIQNISDTNSIKITNSKGLAKTSDNSWITYNVGLPIADSVLNGKLKNSESTGIVINPGETKVIEAYDLAPEFLVGFLQDIDISSVNGGNSKYIIRTVLAQNDEDLTKVHSDPISTDRFAHPRGAWPQSTLKTEIPAYTVGIPEVGYNLSNGQTDHLLTAENSLSTLNGSVGNPGHFGMTYKVSIPIVNPTGSPAKVKIVLAGRGGLYSGAVKMNGKVHLIPTLKPSQEYVELPEYTVSGSSDTINLEIMHAGGANLPVAVYVESVE